MTNQEILDTALRQSAAKILAVYESNYDRLLS